MRILIIDLLQLGGVAPLLVFESACELLLDLETAGLRHVSRTLHTFHRIRELLHDLYLFSGQDLGMREHLLELCGFGLDVLLLGIIRMRLGLSQLLF